MRSVTQKTKRRKKLTPEWLTIKQACAYAGVTMPILKDWMNDGMRFSRINANLVKTKKDWIDDYLITFEGTSDVVGSEITKAIAGMK